MSDDTQSLTGLPRAVRRRLKHHNPLDGLRPYWPNLPRHESRYTPTGPVIGGHAKCEKKGHVPKVFWEGTEFHESLDDGETWTKLDRIAYCSRCKEQV